MIRRQVLDIHTDTREGTWQLQNKMRDLYYEKLIHVLEDALNEMDHPDKVIRIDQLKIDLGNISPRLPEQELVTRFREKINEELNKIVSGSLDEGGNQSEGMMKIPSIRNEEDTLLYFLETGTLHWAASSAHAANFEKLLLDRIHRPGFRGRIAGLLKSPVASQRLLNQFSIAATYELIAALFSRSASQAVIKKQAKDLAFLQKKISEGLSLPPGFEKKLATVFLEICLDSEVSTSDRVQVFRAFIESVYQLAGNQKEKVAVVALKVVLAPGSKEKINHYAEVLLFLKKEIAQIFSLASKGSHPLDPIILRTAFSKNKSTEQTIEALQKLADPNERKPSIDDITISEQTALDVDRKEAFLSDLEKHSDLYITGDEKSITPEDSFGLSENLNNEITEKELQKSAPEVKKSFRSSDDSDPEHNARNEFNPSVNESVVDHKTAGDPVKDEPGDSGHAGKDVHPDQLKALGNQDREEKYRLPVTGKKWPEGSVQDRSGKKSNSPGQLRVPDEVFVSNSGLVLLWNYIPHYLRHFGLVDGSGFVSVNAQHRAVYLLQYISTGRSEVIEYETGLSKILCGLELTDVLETGFTLTDEEKEEADGLLQVVIRHWAALGNTGVNAFRQSFINRNGLLLADKEGWNLKVEQSGIDILLQQMPWSFGIVRMSWMNKPIFVEWN